VTAERVELILFLPENFPPVWTRARMPDSDDRKPLIGRAMVANELNRYSTPLGFRAVGWVGEGLTREHFFGFDVVVAGDNNNRLTG